MSNHLTLFNSPYFDNVYDNLIASHLTIKDIYNMSLTNRRLYKRCGSVYIINQIKYKIKIQLQKIFKQNYDGFVQAMSKSFAVLSGSLVLQCILNEKWNNSDTDIYVESEETEEIMKNFLETLTNEFYEKEDHGGYRAAEINNVTEYFLERDQYKPGITLPGDDKIVQLVQIETSPSYTLWHHINNTGFDICKNLVCFDENCNMQITITNLRGIINKCITFTILDIEDFYFRMEKYSKRGFWFRPKYNKLLCLEYLLLKQKNNTYFKYILKTNFDERYMNKNTGMNKNGHKNLPCGMSCPIKLLYRNVRHYHTYSNERELGYVKYFITVENNNGIFKNIMPELTYNSVLQQEKLLEKLVDCNSVDKYAKIRNKLTKHKIDIFDKNSKYDIKFGLPSDFSLPKKIIVKNVANNKESNDDLIIVKSKNKPKDVPTNVPNDTPKNEQTDIQKNEPKSGELTWADRVKKSLVPPKK